MEHLVQLVVMANLDQGVSRACLAKKEMKDPEDFQAFQAQSDYRVCLGLQERRERMGMLVQWALQVHMVQEVLRVPVELMAHQDHREVLVPWGAMEKRERPVKLETLDLLERLE